MINIDDPERIKRYAVYTETRSTDDGHMFTRSFIVVKNGYGIIERFTRFHEFTDIYKNNTFRPLQANPEAKLYYICSMLNYILVDHWQDFRVRHVFEISKPMLEKFFTDYALQPKYDGSYRTKDTVERCVRFVTSFMARLCTEFGNSMSLTKNELYEERTIVTKKGIKIRKKSPAFHPTGIDDNNSIFRDIPTKAVEILIPLAFRYASDIAFGICIQLFAGLRAGEVCNLRQESSPMGAGIQFIEIAGTVHEIRIDISRNVALRSDNVKTGSIKKPRIQKVYPAFIGTFMKAYDLHKEYLKTISFEEEFAPILVNSYGKAMTYESYRTRFKELINNHLRPLLVNHEDPMLRIYGQMLYENDLAPHVLRHWYTVQLVLKGEDIAGVQSWRGDKCPETAFLYLQNKGDLVRELEKANDRLICELMEIGNELYKE